VFIFQHFSPSSSFWQLHHPSLDTLRFGMKHIGTLRYTGTLYMIYEHLYVDLLRNVLVCVIINPVDHLLLIHYPCLSVCLSVCLCVCVCVCVCVYGCTVVSIICRLPPLILSSSHHPTATSPSVRPSVRLRLLVFPCLYVCMSVCHVNR
jgi:hypothetical protein